MFPKIKIFKVFMLIKNSINIYNLTFFLLYYTLSNNFSPIKFNQFKYFHLIYLSILLFVK